METYKGKKDFFSLKLVIWLLIRDLKLSWRHIWIPLFCYFAIFKYELRKWITSVFSLKNPFIWRRMRSFFHLFVDGGCFSQCYWRDGMISANIDIRCFVITSFPFFSKYNGCCLNCKVSISPTFYARIFCTKVLREAFLY